MVRTRVSLLLISLLGEAFATQVSAQRGSLDPAFDKVPFEQWLGERQEARFHWSVRVSRAELSFHQRLAATIDIRLDGQDLAARRRDGKLLLLIQIKDAEGTPYQEHGSIELSKLDADAKDSYIDYSQPAFFVPGDYQLAVAILDSATGEHSSGQLRFRLASPPHEWLKEAWRALPAIEFIGNEASPESWYLPYIRGRLQWAAAVHSPARLNVILNVAPAVPGPGSHRVPSSDLAALLPSLKALSQTGSAALSERVALLDLSRRRTVFDQNDVHDLDWLPLKASLTQASTASIDVHSLADRHEDAQFFVSEVRRLLRASADKPCVLAVLTQPVSFDSGEDLEPVSLEALPPCRVFYIRYHVAEQFVRPLPTQIRGRGRRGRLDGPMIGSRQMEEAFDQLEATLKPLSPKVMDVETPEQVTKALAEIEKALLKADESSR